MDASQLREYVIRPVLIALGLHSQAAENLLLGTAAQESHMGHYIHQIGGGPALGIFQMEPATHNDIWENFLQYKPDLVEKLKQVMISKGGFPEEMIYNLAYAAAMCRIHYLRQPDPLPHADDVVGMAAYWKKYYNTFLGAGTTDEFQRNYQRYVEQKEAA